MDAMKGKVLLFKSIISTLLETPGCMSEINHDKLRIMNHALLKGDISTDSEWGMRATDH